MEKAKVGLRAAGAAPDLWRHTLSQIPSQFGRLVYLSSLRDANTGQYRHHGLAAVFGEEEANRAMQLSHEEAFATWLEWGLEQQKEDLELYVAGLEPERKKVVETWSRLEPYRNLAPAGCEGVEKALFLDDLETLLSLMRNELGVVSPDPGA
ncbi:MAG: hypothetical protein JST93_31985 [Acidobacteria bacterium]|nr:hypothetical protein [Acidobacteriota bacterium]